MTFTSRILSASNHQLSVVSLGEALKYNISFGMLMASGVDAEGMIAQEHSSEVLQKALDVARSTQDTRWALKIAHRRYIVDRTAETIFDIAQTHISAKHFNQSEQYLKEYGLYAKNSDVWDRMDFEIAAGKNDTRRANAAIKRLRKKNSDTSEIEYRYILLLLSQGKVSEAERGAKNLAVEVSNSAEGVLLSIRLILLRSGPVEAMKEIDSFPDALAQGSVAYDEIKAMLLNLAGRYNECLDFILDSITGEHISPTLCQHALQAARESDRLLQLEGVLSGILSKYPREYDISETLCSLRIELGLEHKTDELLHLIRGRSSWTWMMMHFYKVCQGGDELEVNNFFRLLISDGVRFTSIRISYALYLYYFCADGPSLQKAQNELSTLIPNAKDSPGIQAIYLRILLALGRKTEAEKEYRSLPEGIKQCAELRAFQMYFHAQKGLHQEASEGWKNYLQDSAHMSLNARSSYPEEVTLKYQGNPSNILSFTTIFNGVEYVEWFLTYYRNLGVNHFFFCDNGSTDGTFEYLKDQPDVSLFQNKGSFSASACGVFWVNHLMRRFGVGHWCMHLDMDEALVFPGQDQGRTLRDFTDYMDANGFQATVGPMIDIFPDFSDAENGDDPFESSKYIDIDYIWMKNELPPYYFIKGGMRSRLTGQSLLMTKSPLVKMYKDFAYIANNHQHTHVPIADVTTAVLHYKFIGKYMERFLEAVERGEHFQGARFYRLLSNSVKRETSSDSQLATKGPQIIEYANPSQLVELGILKSSNSWDDT